ncbi:conserved Plasmodium protein, unknown function [Plasmodium vivax]|uniref:(malaria parasite P. vivax) hypothetical protein n=1 Tax=Plasmodium vivax TaxID=5855 RepID=A0A1G4HJT2_PLAVI|nr:unnamed protein product [Plasmodium vivax]CAI7723330.1 conserved Plasmodium protein, unknown function [Plasmodium vivax]SCO69750.1 conserved Plasmodium protein, unknown function [Plasmodium vivax]SCO75240.1 conserved Plasmodium protein, unknown function [Plasmodium vivax]VUZ98698.1 conserved Plasmodium protein, unknown function [Plasmodium vivax]
MGRFLLLPLLAFVCTAYAQLPYDVMNIYKPLNSHSVNAIPGDKMSEEYEVKDIKDEVEKEYSENSLKKLAERYHKDVGEGDQSILEELDQLNDIIGERTLHLNIF